MPNRTISSRYPVYIFLLATSIFGCASPPQLYAYLTPEIRFSTPTPNELDAVIDVAQIITARYRGGTLVFETRLSISPHRLIMIGLDPLGRRAITIDSTSDSITAQTASWLPSFVNASNILADMAIVYWPTESIQRGLVGTGAELRERARQRTISVEGHEIIRVEYERIQPAGWPEMVRYYNNVSGYELTIRSVKVVG